MSFPEPQIIKYVSFDGLTRYEVRPRHGNQKRPGDKTVRLGFIRPRAIHAFGQIRVPAAQTVQRIYYLDTWYLDEGTGNFVWVYREDI